MNITKRYDEYHISIGVGTIFVATSIKQLNQTIDHYYNYTCHKSNKNCPLCNKVGR